jgi:hypothetical protein
MMLQEDPRRPLLTAAPDEAAAGAHTSVTAVHFADRIARRRKLSQMPADENERSPYGAYVAQVDKPITNYQLPNGLIKVDKHKCGEQSEEVKYL